jgi:hypothetical protein
VSADGVAGSRRALAHWVAIWGSLVAATMIVAGAGAAGAAPGARERTGQVVGKEPEDEDRRADELARLVGQRVVLGPGGSYRIADVAGEGAPDVGVVERRGGALWLRPDRGAARRLAGPLAHPRIAGPGYKVWVLGRIGPDGALVARRIGILARPARIAGTPPGRLRTPPDRRASRPFAEGAR